jgi:drug/metabolite transporter (DMT)-like permease
VLLSGLARLVRAASVAQGDIGRLVLAAGCWGLGTVISKAALAEIPPVTLLATQLAVSLVLLIALMRAAGVPLRGPVHPLLARLGLLNPGLAYALSLLGLTTITASVSVLLWALEPLLILVLAVIVLGERLTPLVAALSAGAVIGIGLVVFDPTTLDAQIVGVGLTVAGIGCCALYTVLTRRSIPDAQETSQVVLAQQAYGLVVALILVVGVGLIGGRIVPSTLSLPAIASAIVSGALYYAGAYWLYLGALRRVPASIASSTFYLIPIVGVTGGALLLGERLGPSQWVGAAIVLGSVLGILVQPSRGPVTQPTAG